MNSRRTELMAFCAMVMAALALVFTVRPITLSAAGALAQGPTQSRPAAPEAASFPITFNYQGTLRLSDGSPANGAYTMTLSIYDSVISGTLLHQETAQNVVVRDGLFTVLLGDQAGGPSISPSVFITMPRYLGIAVVPDPEMQPRQRIHAVPWAINAANASNADLLDGQDASVLVPPGTVVAFAGSTPPPGWLLCDGSAVTRTQYATLFAAIGAAHGSGDGSTTFNLPDYRGRFLRGRDGGAGRDPDQAARTAANPGGSTGDAVGSLQGDATKKPNTLFVTSEDGAHVHSYWDMFYSESWGTVPLGYNIGSHSTDYDNLGFQLQRDTQSSGGHSHTVASGGDSETRPVNAYVNWIIKY